MKTVSNIIFAIIAATTFTAGLPGTEAKAHWHHRHCHRFHYHYHWHSHYRSHHYWFHRYSWHRHHYATRACPIGYHLGYLGKHCWPNR